MKLSPLESFVATLPKTDLHVHFEGLVERRHYLAAETMRPIPAESIYKSRFEDVADFIHAIRRSNVVLRTGDDCAAVVRGYLARAAVVGVRHIELAVEPEFHLQRGLDIGELFEGIGTALDEGERAHGITSYIVLSIARDRPPAQAFDTLRRTEAVGVLPKAIGIAGYDHVRPLSDFRDFMGHAAERGYAIVAHAGEGADPEEIWEAVRALPACRIDHGIAALSDPALLRHLRERQIPLATAPISNHMTGVSRYGAATAALLRAGLLVSVNTDDPGVQQTDIADDYRLLVEHQGLTGGECVQLAINGFESSFLPGPAKAQHIAGICALTEEAGER